MSQPKIIVIAGPNGAGKTTFARQFLPQEAGCTDFINADLIAAGLSPFAPEKVAIQAGRLMIEAIAARVAQGQGFALETTLSGVGYARQIPRWRQEGFRIELYFLSLPNADVAVERVAQRVRQGGHSIPEATIRRRYDAGLRLFDSAYKQLVDGWAFFDNSQGVPVLLDCEGMKIPPGAAMEPQPTYDARVLARATPLQRGALDALRRAARDAREIARQTGTDLILVRDGRVVRVKPSELPPDS